MNTWDAARLLVMEGLKRASEGLRDSRLAPEGDQKPARGNVINSSNRPKITPVVVAAVDQWSISGKPQQKPIRWPQHDWIREFPELAVMLNAMPNPLSREDVRKTVQTIPSGEEGAVAAFVVCMAWGYGRTGYGRARTRKILADTSDAAKRLDEARAIASGGSTKAAVDSYAFLGGRGRLRGLGPAFGTKYIHFHNEQGLILDKLTADWFRSVDGVNLRPTLWNSGSYRQYLESMQKWARETGVSPNELEQIAFSSMSRARGNQWA